MVAPPPLAAIDGPRVEEAFARAASAAVDVARAAAPAEAAVARLTQVAWVAALVVADAAPTP